MTQVATRPTRLGDLLKGEFWQEHGYERQIKSITVGTDPEIGEVYKGDGTILSASDVGYTVTPVVANSVLYTLSIRVNGVSKSFEFTSSGAATAAEIVDGFVTLINADADVNSSVTASNVSDTLFIEVIGDFDVRVSVTSGNMEIDTNFDSLSILVDDNVYFDGLGAGTREYVVLSGGPGASGGAIVVKEQLKFGDSLTAAQKDAVSNRLNAQGIKVGTQV